MLHTASRHSRIGNDNTSSSINLRVFAYLAVLLLCLISEPAQAARPSGVQWPCWVPDGLSNSKMIGYANTPEGCGDVYLKYLSEITGGQYTTTIISMTIQGESGNSIQYEVRFWVETKSQPGDINSAFRMWTIVAVPQNLKEAGQPKNGTCYGNPCNPATGNKITIETDFKAGNGLPSLTRIYNSSLSATINTGFGWGWTNGGYSKLSVDGNKVVLRKGDGSGITFDCASSPCTSDIDSNLVLQKEIVGFIPNYTLFYRGGVVEKFNNGGNLTQRIDANGQITRFTYRTDGSGTQRLSSILGPFGHSLGFVWDDASGTISSVTLPDNNKILLNIRVLAVTEISLKSLTRTTAQGSTITKTRI